MTNYIYHIKRNQERAMRIAQPNELKFNSERLGQLIFIACLLFGVCVLLSTCNSYNFQYR